MADRPILFSAPMVRALLDGRKTQTRRALSRNWPVLGSSWRGKKAPWEGLDFTRAVARDKNTMAIALVGRDEAWPDPHLDVPFLHPEDAARGAKWDDDQCWYRVRPPFEIGDRLWVKERFTVQQVNRYTSMDGRHVSTCIDFDAGPAGYEARQWVKSMEPDTPKILQAVKQRKDATRPLVPGIFLPRIASRLTLAVTDVRVQRLQECSEADATAEGLQRRVWDVEEGSDAEMVEGWSSDRFHAFKHGVGQSPREGYAILWNSINGAGSWEANPWVVAVTFDVRKGNIDG